MTGAEELELGAGAAADDATLDAADVAEEEETGGGGAAAEPVATEAGLLAFVVGAEEAGVDGTTVGA